MSYEVWKDKTSQFQTIDVQHIQGNFFPGLRNKADALEVGEGLHIVQTFRPHPLYQALEELGFEHHTEELSPTEFHAYFYRTEKKSQEKNTPFRPLALLNYPMIVED